MKKLLWVSALVTVSGLMSGLVAAQEVGKVISSTPVLKRVTEPRSTCTDEAAGQQRCRTEMVTEDRNIGYTVVYEYAGRQHTVQLPFAPGATIPLDVQVSVQGATPTPAIPSYAPVPSYSSDAPMVARESVYVEPAYYPPVYYPSRYAYPGYYYDPLYPILGLTLGYAAGYYGHSWRGGFRGGGHWGGRGHR